MWEAAELINVLECDRVNLTRAGFEDETWLEKRAIFYTEQRGEWDW